MDWSKVRGADFPTQNDLFTQLTRSISTDKRRGLNGAYGHVDVVDGGVDVVNGDGDGFDGELDVAYVLSRGVDVYYVEPKRQQRTLCSSSAGSVVETLAPVSPVLLIKSLAFISGLSCYHSYDMPSVETIYRETVLPLPENEQVRLAQLILKRAAKQRSTNGGTSIVEYLKSIRKRTATRTAAEIDEQIRRERDSWDD